MILPDYTMTIQEMHLNSLRKFYGFSLKKIMAFPLVNFIGLLFFLSIGLNSFTQIQKQSFFLDHYTTRDGLSYNTCNDIIKDRLGFIWIATENGLNRFDGKNFHTYYSNPYDTTSPVGNMGYSLYEDMHGYIWYCTFSSGMNRYDPVTDKFHRYPPPSPGANDTNRNEAIVVFESPGGKLWMANERGLCYFDTADKKIKLAYFKGEKQPINPSPIKSILEDSKKNLWLTTFNGVYRVDFLQNRLFHLDADVHTNWLACDIKEDRKGNIWIGYWGAGLKKYDPESGSITTFWADPVNKLRNEKNIFSNICFQRVNNRDVLWASSAGNLLYELDMDTEQLIQHNIQKYFPAHSQTVAVRKVYTDNSNKLWLATTYGVIKIDPLKQLFHSFELPVSKAARVNVEITSLYHDTADHSGNTIWLGLMGAGIKKYSLQTGQVKSIKGLQRFATKSFYPVQISRGPFNDLWIACKEGIIRYNEEKDFYKLIPFDFIIRCFWFDGKSKLWLGTNNGIFFYDVYKNRFHKLPEPGVPVHLSSNINGLCVSKTGNIWFSRGYTSGKSAGVSVVNAENLRQTAFYQHAKLNPDFPFYDEAFSIFCDSKDQIWVGTFKGLVVFDGAQKKPEYKIIAPFNGLPSNKVFHIFQQDSSIWVNGHNGVSIIDMHSHRVLTTFTEEQGLFSISMNIMKEGTGGKVFLADKGTFQYINTGIVSVKPSPPVVFISNIKVLNKEDVCADTSALFLKQLNLTYRQNAIEFHFTAPDFINPGEIKYAYKLEGVDEDWIYTSEAHASYNNLDGGNYIFTVKAGNSVNEWNKKPAIFTFKVNAPWWKTSWFYLLSAVIILAILYSIYYIRVSRLKELLKVRNNIARDLHDDVGSTLSSISIMSEVAKQTPQSAVLLQKIGSDAQLMQENISDIVWAINPKNDHFKDLLQRMKMFSSEMLEAKNIELQFSADEALHHLKLSMHYRKNFYFIFKEAIINLAKYSACKSAKIKVTLHDKVVSLLVEDDGKGFDPNHQTMGGNGLDNMQARAKDLNGILKIDSLKDTGTRVHLRFKIT